MLYYDVHSHVVTNPTDSVCSSKTGDHDGMKVTEFCLQKLSLVALTVQLPLWTGSCAMQIVKSFFFNTPLINVQASKFHVTMYTLLYFVYLLFCIFYFIFVRPLSYSCV